MRRNSSPAACGRRRRAAAPADRGSRADDDEAHTGSGRDSREHVLVLAGEPIILSGSIYYPAGPEIYFNPYKMVRSGEFRGVPF